MKKETFLDGKTKNVLLILSFVFLPFVLLFSIFDFLIKNFMNKETKIIDKFVNKLVKNNIVNNKKELIKAVFYQENRMFYNDCKLYFRLLIIITFITLIISILFNDGPILSIFNKALNLLPLIKWPTVKETNDMLLILGYEYLLKLPSSFPASFFPIVIFKTINFSDPLLYVSMIYYICILICAFLIFKNVIAHIARINKGFLLSNKLFNQKENKESFVNSIIPNQKQYEVKE